MIGLLFVITASCCASISNYFMRRSQDSGGSGAVFLLIQLFLSLIVSIVLNPIRTHTYQLDPCMAAFGFIGGIILGVMMLSLNQALKFGPPGLTFACVNSACVMPGILMTLIFGASFGYLYSFWNGLGSFLVIAGLFWAGFSERKMKNLNMWMLFIFIAFTLQMTGMAWLEWRAFLVHYPKAIALLATIEMDAKNEWFLPMLFLGAFLVQCLNWLKTERCMPKTPEILCGFLGGVANGSATFFLMFSTEYASHFEKAMIFPVFAVLVIVLCNIWGQWFYKEKINWWAAAICLIGLFIGTFGWDH